MTINKFAITLTALLSVSLLPQEMTEKCLENRRTIKISPLYESVYNSEATKSLKQNPQPIKKRNFAIQPAEWILKSSIKNAPQLLKGIVSYLKNYPHNADDNYTIPSFHRFILVGPPGSGKTTMAHAIAHQLGYSVIFIGAIALLGHFRNETAKNIQGFLRECTKDCLKKVIIIDELHKLFEHHTEDRADDSQSAAAFWIMLDEIEKLNPNVIIIGTANNVSKLPPELKSRFSGKIITLPLPSKNQKIQAFKDIIANDATLVLDKSVNNVFIAKIIETIHDCSLRDIKLIIDTAKMFYYAEKTQNTNVFRIILTKSHFQHAMNQLQEEALVLEMSFIDQLGKKLEPWGTILSAAANISVFARACSDITTIIISKILQEYSGKIHHAF